MPFLYLWLARISILSNQVAGEEREIVVFHGPGGSLADLDQFTSVSKMIAHTANCSFLCWLRLVVIDGSVGPDEMEDVGERLHDAGIADGEEGEGGQDNVEDVPDVPPQEWERRVQPVGLAHRVGEELLTHQDADQDHRDCPEILALLYGLFQKHLDLEIFIKWPMEPLFRQKCVRLFP